MCPLKLWGFGEDIGSDMNLVGSFFTALRNVNYPEVDSTGPVFKIVKEVLKRLILSLQCL